jgi:hypothetical protein
MEGSMSIGLGIFLGCVFLGTIYLFIHTRDTWHWKTIWKRGFLVVLGSVFISVLVIATIIYGFLLYEESQQRPQVVSSLKGITIGDTLSDVMFKYGDVKKLGEDKDKVPKDGEEISYWSAKRDLAVDVRNNIVTKVWHLCNSKEVDYEEVNGIACGDTGERINTKFPNKVRMLCPKTNDKDLSLSRNYDVVEYGTRYVLDENKVTGFLIMETRELQSMFGVNWDVCGKQ